MGGRILIIKLGALGDFVQALGPMAAVRAHHKDAHITLLTTAAYAGLGRACPYLDAVWVDARPGLWNVPGWLALRARLRGGGFDRVYDLQTSDRSGFYFRLMGKNTDWSGIAPGCSHPHANPDRDFMHTADRQREQLEMAGIARVPAPDLGWLTADVARFGAPVDGSGTYALLAPGGAAHRAGKRWPAGHCSHLARRLAAARIRPGVLGPKAEADVLAAITAAVPEAVDLGGSTDFADIATLARGCHFAVGNDTGPMHLIAASGAKAVVLFSHASDPALCAPRGRAVTVLRSPRLDRLGIDTVMRAALS